MTALPTIATALTMHGRGVLAVDQPLDELALVLRRARVPAGADRCRALRHLALTTPGLDRLVNGVLVDPELLRAAAARFGARPPIPGPPRLVGVRLRVRGAASTGERAGRDAELSRHAAAGAAFAGCRLDAAEGLSTTVLQVRARTVAELAAACQRNGLVPLVDCATFVPGRSPLVESEQRHTAVLAALAAAFDRCGVDPAATVLGLDPVAPGTRSHQADDPVDGAMATLRSLRASGIGAVAGIVFRPPGGLRSLAAQLGALQRLCPEQRIGLLLGTGALTAAAMAWRGRPERVGAAHHELQTGLTGGVAVLRAGLAEAR
ncbi:class I fructose-bisphosphate aldolase [Pseudonocardia sp. GCM10023141]|uniref:class I fructose-bisphosphate aldolase n=1 Tax=Pseudonocardia sp. GCM10023141 TaxID=3252653 RepID=UPI00361C9777